MKICPILCWEKCLILRSSYALRVILAHPWLLNFNKFHIGKLLSSYPKFHRQDSQKNYSDRSLATTFIGCCSNTDYWSVTVVVIHTDCLSLGYCSNNGDWSVLAWRLWLQYWGLLTLVQACHYIMSDKCWLCRRLLGSFLFILSVASELQFFVVYHIPRHASDS